MESVMPFCICMVLPPYSHNDMLTVLLSLHSHRIISSPYYSFILCSTRSHRLLPDFSLCLHDMFMPD